MKKNRIKQVVICLTLIFSVNFIHAQSYEACSWYFNGRIQNAVKIKTNIPFTSVQMPTIRIEGYNYGTSQPIGINLVYYIYNGSFSQYGATNWGSYAPNMKLANEGGFVIIYIDDRPDFMRFKVTVFAQGLGESAAQYTGWTVADEKLSSTAQSAVAVSLQNQTTFEACSWFINGTVTNGIKIKTNLPFSNSSQMPSIRIEGYNYGTAKPVGINLVYYIYNGNFSQYGATAWGGYAPNLKLANEGGFVVIYLDDRPSFMRFKVAVFAQGLGAETPANLTGWSVADESLSAGSATTVSVPYQNANAATLQQVTNAGSITTSGATFGGKVAVGTNTPNFTLDASFSLLVKGGVRAEKVKVDVSNGTWADFVFKPDYELPKLEIVAQFINKNGHLPNIPTEQEVQKEGIDLGSMNTKLLQKVEELTLYLIEMKKEVDKLKKEMVDMKNRK